LIPRFGRARRDSELAVLEGLHAVKHALRFGAEIHELVTRSLPQLSGLLERLAPDVAEPVLAAAREVDEELFAKLVPLPPSTGVVAIASRPGVDLAALLSDVRPAPLLLLEDPRDLGNIGACVRVAAAADMAGVLSTGSHDPWHPDALRGGAGLQFALPVTRLAGFGQLTVSDRPVLALDPDGEPLRPRELDPRAILAFGTERDGISEELGALADARISIPMRPGVSSLNLATSVAAVLFAWRLNSG
jgi:TrmH family RNA methyltransferase